MTHSTGKFRRIPKPSFAIEKKRIAQTCLCVLRRFVPTFLPAFQRTALELQDRIVTFPQLSAFGHHGRTIKEQVGSGVREPLDKADKTFFTQAPLSDGKSGELKLRRLCAPMTVVEASVPAHHKLTFRANILKVAIALYRDNPRAQS